MNRCIYIILFGIVTSFLGQTVLGGEIIKAPALTKAKVGNHEKNVFNDTLSPGRRIWDFGLKGKLTNYASTESVGDGAGMIIYLPAGTNGRVVAYGTAARGNTLKEFKGISFWVKGDGSDAQGVIGWNWNVSFPFSFSLKETSWRKVYVYWKDFGENFKGSYFLNYSINPNNYKGDSYYIIDRVRFFKEEKTEAITPTPNRDPAGDISSDGLVSNREAIKDTIAKLTSKKDVTIAIIGDSITCGAQLWYAGKKTYLNYAYPVLAARGIAKAFGYPEPTIIYETYDKKQSKWNRVMGKGLVPGKGLTVVILGAGGQKTKFAVENLKKVFSFDPDLIYSQYGVNDIPFGKLEEYRKQTTQLIKAVNAKGIALAIGTPTSNCGLTKIKWLGNQSLSVKGLPFAQEARVLAKQHDLALVDMRKAFDARGIRYLGDLYSDQYHPNHRGHKIMATMLETLFTGKQSHIWQGVPVLKNK